MNIAIEASNLARPDKTGVAVYGTNLISHLAERDRENRYYLCYRLSRIRKKRFFFRTVNPNFRVKIIQEPFNRLFMKRMDLYHGLDARVYESGGMKKVVTVHDVLHYTDVFPVEPYPAGKIEKYRKMLSAADAIIAVSHHTRKDLVQQLSVAQEKIEVVYHGVEERFRARNPQETRAVLDRYGIGSSYLLYVGCIEARKNLSRLLEAFARVRKGGYPSFELVMAGNPGEGADTVFQTVGKLGLEECVRIVGYVQQEDLPFLYTGAEIFLFPSLYEGFGMPVLEAMACGTPVVASSVTSIPEVAGEAALLVDPHSVESISSAIQSLLGDPSLRKAYAHKGIVRAGEFTWEKAAKQTLEVYRKVLGA